MFFKNMKIVFRKPSIGTTRQRGRGGRRESSPRLMRSFRKNLSEILSLQFRQNELWISSSRIDISPKAG
jgi:hypothetical protein